MATSERLLGAGTVDVPQGRDRDAVEPRVPVAIKAAWGAGGLGAQLAINMMGPLALFFLTTMAGIPPLVAGYILMVAKICDAFSDPMAGVWSDRSRSPRGRRRPFMLWGSLLTAVSLVAAFTMPFSGDSWSAWIWALSTLVVLTLGYSIFNVPYMAMPSEMTTGYHERSSIHSYRVMFAVIGTMLANSGAGIVLGLLSTPNPGRGAPINTAFDYTLLASLFALIALVSMLVAWRGTRHAPTVARTETTLPALEQVRTILANRPFVVIISAKALQLLGVSASGAATFFLVVNVLERSPAALALIGIPFTLTGLAVTPLLYRISRRIGKRATFIITMMFPAAANLSWLLAQPGDPDWTLIVRGCLIGVGFSGTMLFAMSMLSDTIEVDSARTGLRREGTYMAVYSFAEKFAASFGPAIMGVALAYAGFDNQAVVTPESYARVREATMFGAAIVPAICAALAATLVGFFYRIDTQAMEQAATMFVREPGRAGPPA